MRANKVPAPYLVIGQGNGFAAVHRTSGAVCPTRGTYEAAEADGRSMAYVEKYIRLSLKAVKDEVTHA